MMRPGLVNYLISAAHRKKACRQALINRVQRHLSLIGLDSCFTDNGRAYNYRD
jgi:hypothetical protein